MISVYQQYIIYDDDEIDMIQIQHTVYRYSILYSIQHTVTVRVNASDA